MEGRGSPKWSSPFIKESLICSYIGRSVNTFFEINKFYTFLKLIIFFDIALNVLYTEFVEMDFYNYSSMILKQGGDSDD